MNYLNDTEIKRRNLYEILSLNQDLEKDWEIIERQYKAVDIHKVVIDGNPFTNYGDFQFIWEMSYVTEPKRSGNGSIGNLNSYAVFLTPHLTLNFSIMSIDDYRKIMQLHYSIKEHMVECYDPIYNQKIKVKMYFATEQMAKLHTIARKRFNGAEWEDWIELVGVREYTVDLIGTNNELDLISVSYNYNAPKDESGNPIYPNGVPVVNEYEKDIYAGEDVVIGGNCTFKDTPPSNKYKFKKWVDRNGTEYTDGTIITINQPLELFAQWETTDIYKLSFNYGIAQPYEQIDSTTGEITIVYDKDVQYGKQIGTLPTPTNPYVEDANKGIRYYPYINGNWYWLPVKDESKIVYYNEYYERERNSIIYYLYDKKSYNVTYVTNMSEYSIPIQTVEYGEKVFAPTLAKEGYTFQGWYLDKYFVTAFSGNMPPKEITLYAKWEKNK